MIFVDRSGFLRDSLLFLLARSGFKLGYWRPIDSDCHQRWRSRREQSIRRRTPALNFVLWSLTLEQNLGLCVSISKLFSLPEERCHHQSQILRHHPSCLWDQEA